MIWLRDTLALFLAWLIGLELEVENPKTGDLSRIRWFTFTPWASISSTKQ